MFKKLLILSLSFVCFANLFCMETSNTILPKSERIGNQNPDKPFDADGNQIIVEKNGLLSLPIDILLEVIKFCAEMAENEQDLAKIAWLSCVNKYFNNLLNQETNMLKYIWMLSLNKLEQLKKQYYKNARRTYNIICRNKSEHHTFKIPNEYTCTEYNLKFCAEEISKTKLVKNITDFKKNAGKNISEIIDGAVAYKSFHQDLLRKAAQEENLDLMVLALNNGWEQYINVALQAAVDGYEKRILDLLLRYKPKITPKVFESALYSNDEEIIKKLIEFGADVNCGTIPPLVIAANMSFKKVLGVLLENGARINIKTSRHGLTALMVVASRGGKEIVKFLINKDADINAKDNYGWTALMWAAHKGHKEIVELFLANGAELTRKDIKKIDTTFFFKTEMVRFLEAYLHQKENSAQKSTPNNNASSKKDSCIIA